MRVSVQIATRNRLKPLCRAITSVLSQDYHNFEALVLDDDSEARDICARLREKFGDPRIRCFRNSEWSGVSAVRAKMMDLGEGDIYCSIDDDGAFAHDACLSRIVAAFQENPKLGLLAGKIKDYRDGKERLLLPFSKAALLRDPHLAKGPQKVSYFRAGCYAVRREVIENCGGYRRDMIYGEEELDLSYRIIAAGYDIVYVPGVVAFHWPEPSAFGNTAPHGEIYYQIQNRFHLAYAYLPVLYWPSYLTIWMSHYLAFCAKTGQVSEYLAGVRDGIRNMRREPRWRLDGRTLAYLRSNYGRLWY